MKTMITFLKSFLIAGLIIIGATSINAQSIANFENLSLSPSTYWNGADSTGGFTSGDVYFYNSFTDWGGGITSWAGFAYTNMKDDSTQGFTNQYSAITAEGYNHSSNYAIGYCDPYSIPVTLKINSNSNNDSISGIYVTNDSYPALSMKYGDAYSKKFGGVSGDDPDWFVLTIYGYKNNVKKADTVNFYLADFRFADNQQDYIVTDWQWVDLKVFGKVDSMVFKLSSSDMGMYGMNTPAYFCIDNIKKLPISTLGVNELSKNNDLSLYPNPASTGITINSRNQIDKIYIYNLQGKECGFYSDVNSNISHLNVNNLNAGVYMIKVVDENENATFEKLIKK